MRSACALQSMCLRFCGSDGLDLRRRIGLCYPMQIQIDALIDCPAKSPTVVLGEYLPGRYFSTVELARAELGSQWAAVRHWQIGGCGSPTQQDPLFLGRSPLMRTGGHPAKRRHHLLPSRCRQSQSLLLLRSIRRHLFRRHLYP